MRILLELGRWILWASLLVVALAISEHIHIAIETPNNVIHINAVLSILAVFFVTWVLLSLMRGIHALFQPRPFDASRQRQQIIASYEAAVQCVFEGRYQKALHHAEHGEQLLKTLPDNEWEDRRILFKLIAARANLLNRQFDQTEQILEDPLLQRPTADAARCLIGAQAALERKQPARALEYLDYLESHQGLHRQAYQIKLRALQRAGQWNKVNETVQTMLKRGFMEPFAATHLQRVAATHLIRECELHPKALHALWNLLPEKLQQHPDLLREWLKRTDSLTESEGLSWLFKEVERFLNAQWDDTLWTAYAFHSAHSPHHILIRGEQWLTQHPDNAQLLHGLGELCTRLRLWGKARSYLEAARSIQPDRTSIYALIKLYQSEGNHDAAKSLLQEMLENELAALQKQPTSPEEEKAS